MMKFNTKQCRIISKIYSDIESIEDNSDLKKRNISLNDYWIIREAFHDIQQYGKSETFISEVAAYFQKFGFIVKEDFVNYVISIEEDLTQ